MNEYCYFTTELNAILPYRWCHMVHKISYFSFSLSLFHRISQNNPDSVFLTKFWERKYRENRRPHTLSNDFLGGDLRFFLLLWENGHFMSMMIQLSFVI
jgi:hypothetical protein